MYKFLSILLLLFSTGVRAQDVSVTPVLPDSDMQYCLPLDMEPFLAGNFGELRNNHFHAGLDFKTQSTVNHPVRAFADGYVCRAGINAYGYGLVLYVRHPQYNLTSVYAHLNGFSAEIYNKVRARQAEMEENNPQIWFEPDELPVRMGDIIAQSGNTGSSGGPHVHFELRDCNDDDDAFYNPMPFFADSIADHKPPRASHVYLYPLGGWANGQGVRQSAAVIVQQSGRRTLNRTFTAWGRVGLGIKAYDYMENQSNTYGVTSIKLFMDDRLIYSFSCRGFRHSECRFTNSLTDYPAWINQRSLIQKSFIEPGNRLQMIDRSLGDGSFVIDEERLYQFRYELSDAHGNKSEVSFSIKGKKETRTNTNPIWSDLPSGTRTEKGVLVRSQEPFRLDTLGCRISIEPGNLYSDAVLPFRRTVAAENVKPGVSDIYTIGDVCVPIHGSISISIPIPQSYADTLTCPEQLYIVNADGGYVGGEYRDGAVHADVNTFGRYMVRRDSTRPTAAFTSLTWHRGNLSLSDSGSGIRSYKVFIDGHFVPFDMNRYGRRYGYPIHFGIEKGKTHEIVIHVVDNCGNESVIETKKYF